MILDFGRDNSRVVRFCIMVFCCIEEREGQSGIARKVAKHKNVETHSYAP